MVVSKKEDEIVSVPMRSRVTVTTPKSVIFPHRHIPKCFTPLIPQQPDNKCRFPFSNERHTYVFTFL